MSLLDEFRRVSRSLPCPICEHTDWCLVSRDVPLSKAICKRVESPRRWGEAGWLHRLREDQEWRVRPRRALIEMNPVVPDLGAYAEWCRAQIRPDELAAFASTLGVTPGSLSRLSVGWNGWAWSFPMRGVTGTVQGIRLRRPDGRKLAVRGGRDGLFVPTDLPDRSVLVVGEGPTDTAALLDLGAAAIGRPSCTGGVRLLVEYVRTHQPKTVAIASDADAAGQRGAAMLGAVLSVHCREVTTFTPPGKDVRSWLNAGATRADLCDALASAVRIRLPVRVRRAR